MKSIKFYIITGLVVLTGCHKLELNPLSDPSTGNFFSNESELTIAVNDLYRSTFLSNDSEEYSDNYWNRAKGGNAVTFGTMASDNSDVLIYWTSCYQAIARANTILASLDKVKGVIAASVVTSIEAQARFSRAYEYSRLISHFGDVPFLKTNVTLAESFSVKRSPVEEVLGFVFSELDFAAANLPDKYSSGSEQRWTKGAALAIKARTALYFQKYDVARDASNNVIKLAQQGVYSLYPSYRNLFLSDGEISNEIIISTIKSQDQNVFDGTEYVKNFLSRNLGGYGAYIPTWELVDSYECTDGLPIDKSPLYNPNQPFKNRDPRLSATVVPFSTNWLGFDYQPHPDSLTVMNYKTGLKVKNNDTRANAAFASYTGFLFKKGIDQSWATKLVNEDDVYIIRYAEVLLTYAEAKIELNQIDASVLNAINQVKARGYGVNVSSTTNYPAITVTDQSQLRTILRRERRVEFANEGLRYMDLIRWKLAGKALTNPVIGLSDPANQNRSKWPFPGTPVIDENGIPDYKPFLNQVKTIALRTFDQSKQYLWPIPTVEIRVNPGLTQNPGY